MVWIWYLNDCPMWCVQGQNQQPSSCMNHVQSLSDVDMRLQLFELDKWSGYLPKLVVLVLHTLFVVPSFQCSSAQKHKEGILFINIWQSIKAKISVDTFKFTIVWLRAALTNLLSNLNAVLWLLFTTRCHQSQQNKHSLRISWACNVLYVLSVSHSAVTLLCLPHLFFLVFVCVCVFPAVSMSGLKWTGHVQSIHQIKAFLHR